MSICSQPNRFQLEGWEISDHWFVVLAIIESQERHKHVLFIIVQAHPELGVGWDLSYTYRRAREK